MQAYRFRLQASASSVQAIDSSRLLIVFGFPDSKVLESGDRLQGCKSSLGWGGLSVGQSKASITWPHLYGSRSTSSRTCLLTSLSGRSGLSSLNVVLFGRRSNYRLGQLTRTAEWRASTAEMTTSRVIGEAKESTADTVLIIDYSCNSLAQPSQLWGFTFLSLSLRDGELDSIILLYFETKLDVIVAPLKLEEIVKVIFWYFMDFYRPERVENWEWSIRKIISCSPTQNREHIIKTWAGPLKLPKHISQTPFWAMHLHNSSLSCN